MDPSLYWAGFWAGFAFFGVVLAVVACFGYDDDA